MAVVVTWNPEAWDFPDGQYEAMIGKTQAGGTYPDDWSVGRRVKGINVGDRVFLFPQGHDRRGLVAAGAISPPALRPGHRSTPASIGTAVGR